MKATTWLKENEHLFKNRHVATYKRTVAIAIENFRTAKKFFNKEIQVTKIDFNLATTDLSILFIMDRLLLRFHQEVCRVSTGDIARPHIFRSYYLDNDKIPHLYLGLVHHPEMKVDEIMDHSFTGWRGYRYIEQGKLPPISYSVDTIYLGPTKNCGYEYLDMLLKEYFKDDSIIKEANKIVGLKLMNIMQQNNPHVKKNYTSSRRKVK